MHPVPFSPRCRAKAQRHRYVKLPNDMHLISKVLLAAWDAKGVPPDAPREARSRVSTTGTKVVTEG